MADVIRKATNKFTKGLVMDFSPENTKNEVLTHALNATLLTFNGNELSLQNDMGNARVETAYLPEGYIPVGTCEYGGVIYIVSYNPLEDKSQIGCFPSPERNVSRHELGEDVEVTLTNDYFQGTDGQIKNTTQYVLLKNDKLNPGDKFLICANEQIYDEKLENLLVREKTEGESENFDFVNNPILALNIVSIEDSGKIVYLNNDVRTYTSNKSYTDQNGNIHNNEYKYHIVGDAEMSNNQLNQATLDPDSYRDVLSSGYSIFRSKTSGKLAILAELIMIDSYNVTHSLIPKKDSFGQTVEGAFDIVIHTEITPEVTNTNYNTVPKLQYYYLQQSQGLLSTFSDSGQEEIKIPLYVDQNGTKDYTINSAFTSFKLSDLYEKTVSDEYFNGKLNDTLYNSGKFNFPVPETYHGRMIPYKEDLNEKPSNIYTKFTEGKYHRVKQQQVYKDDTTFKYFVEKLHASFYYYVQGSKEYTKWEEETLNNTYTYYTEVTTYQYGNAQRNAEIFKDANRPLYKLVSEPRIAKEEEIANKDIEKFTYVQILTIRPATSEELSNNTPLFKKDGDKYVQITGNPESGKTYYVWSEEMVLVSIGYEIDSEQHYDGIYIYPTTKSYTVASKEDLDIYWDFETYPKTNEEPYGCPIVLFYQEPITTYEPASAEDLLNYKPETSVLYYQSNYVYIYPSEVKSLPADQDIFMVVPIDVYAPYTKFEPNVEYNYIEGYDKPDGDYPKDDPISLYTVADFIPQPESEDPSYNDLILANIKIPLEVTTNGLDLPFKYDYTIVPCMNYGRLDHLAVSNTVDFSKLHAFDQSNFNTWKYHIDGEQLRLTFGADIYDTYEEHKVSGLLLEFYDLWGFAGSLEINNKKSYNGLFTKVLHLNTSNVLSKKKLVGETALNESFIRNININYNQETGEFTFNDTPVAFNDEYTGWTGIDEENNDCGTLYPNILYTVKTYLRHEGAEGVKYLPKREFFLYTLPILNDYYYNVSDFSTISSPPLDLILTYKLQDSSSQLIYNQEGDSEKNTIIKGYYKQDSDLLSQYTSGYVGNNVTTINTVKYVNYTGQTNLYLEVGLKQDYQEFGLKYSPNLNERFSCTINLVGNNDGEVYNVISNNSDDPTTDSGVLLNYYHGDNTPIDMAVNTLKFGTTNDSKLELTNFRSHNFLNPKDSVSIPIPINYNFVVGYPINVTNISDTEIQALTICALCHQDDNGEYNYSDFGIYEQGDRYLSETMWYNGGTYEVSRLGVCRMGNPDAEFMGDQCSSIDFAETNSSIIKTPGKLNTGDQLKQMKQYIGKLTFCQPHAHCLREDEGVNIHGYSGSPYHAIPPEYGGFAVGDNRTDNTYGILPWKYLYQNPKYNLCLHTKNVLNNYNEFISTLDHNVLLGKQMCGFNYDRDQFNWTTVDKMLEYTGLEASQLSDYNQKLVQTMKKVYAYNPDYDYLKMKAGDASVVDNKINFTSHIISEKAQMQFVTNETLNDFIYFGNIKVSDYIDFMWKHSAYEEKDRVKVYSDSNTKKPQDQITFIEKLDYCGGEDPYLVSTLTYNTPAPVDLQSEWALKASNPVVVRKENRECVIVNGTPNKKALYGFDENSQKLVELDVSNYTIGSDGILHISESINTDVSSGVVDTSSNVIYPKKSYVVNLNNNDEITVDIELKLDISAGETVYLKSDENTSYIMKDLVNNNKGAILKVKIDVPKVNGVSYKTNSVTVEGVVVGRMLTSNIFSLSGFGEVDPVGQKIGLRDQNVETLKNLLSDHRQRIALTDPSGNNYYVTNSDCWVGDFHLDHGVSINEMAGVFTTSKSGQYEFNFKPTLEKGLGLFAVSIHKISFNLIKSQPLNTVEGDIISGISTTKYAKIENHKYTIESDYNDARIRGTSITINDLEYDYKGDHRLFVKKTEFIKHDPYLRNKLYYRSNEGCSNVTSESDNYNGPDIVNNGKWYYGKDNTNDINTLYFYTGPCFTKDNL